ncbi:alpha-amylase family glycosyl hydrolase [Paenisporosarcina indica]|uniref:alpha-amylase family glycosyl hydrolase n=1 Tax=Paenisporosarcina indica TaxID=650093 RepID=UPI00094F545A|nr:alpha-amylase family glycosyl hydrolase [Paenisporosarcina indica]
MKIGIWIKTAITLALSISLIPPIATQAAEKQTIQDESIYDLLVDRYFNTTIENDFEVDTRKPNAFAGGDLLGVADKLDHIQKLGFTMISLGPIFSTETYDGKRVLDYSTIERHFGTSEEMNTLLEKTHDNQMKVIVDFPMQNVSADHVWAVDSAKSSWVINNEDGSISWDYSNEDVQKAVQEAASTFVQQYDVDGIRLTAIEGINTNIINQMIDSLKEVNKDLYVISNEESNAKFDALLLNEQENVFRNIFKNVDLDTLQLSELTTQESVINRTDSLESRRFTADAAEENMFPPMRWKMVMATLLSIPGVPIMTYGSEIAVNGEKPPESHPILNFKTDEELIEYIGDVQYLRNNSAALRTGQMEMLHNKDGFMIYKRWNDEETWIVAINNTSGTQSFDLSKEIIGDNQELRGLFESDILRQRDDGNYRLVIDREIAEFYTVKDKVGINKSYLAALALVYLLFMGFIYLVWRKGKQRKHNRVEEK